MKEITLAIRVVPEFAEELKDVANKLDLPYSHIAREAIREKIAELKRTDPKLKNAEVAVAEVL